MTIVPEPSWSEYRVRLFPSDQIRGGREAERRAAASLLAMAKAVSEFGQSMVAMAGGPKGRLECYTEVPFKQGGDDGAGKPRPDGIIDVRRGKTRWRALVEVKVGSAALEQPQIDKYLKLAGEENFDAIVTVSNQAALSNGLPPGLNLDGRRLRRIPVVHLSWDRLLSEARMLSGKKAVADEDQAWMLDEWIRYVADPNSKIIEEPQFGKYWPEVLRAAGSQELASCGPQLEDVVAHWDSYLTKLSLRLRAKLGVDVHLWMTRAQRADPTTRIRDLHARALREGILPGLLRIPGAVGDIAVDVLLQSKNVRYSVEIKAPSQGRQRTRVNWLLRQLERLDVPSNLSIRVDWAQRNRQSRSALAVVRQDPAVLYTDSSRQAVPGDVMPRSFVLEQTVPLQKGRSRSTVLEGVSVGLERFYQGVVENLRAYVPPAPKMPEEPREEDQVESGNPEPASLDRQNESIEDPLEAPSAPAESE